MLGRHGSDAVEYAGLALVEAANTFDPTKGVPFRGWAAQQLTYTWRMEWRKQSRHQSKNPEFEIADNDEVSRLVGSDALHNHNRQPSARLEEHEQVTNLMTLVNELDGPARLILMAKVIARFKTSDIARILDIGAPAVRCRIRVIEQVADTLAAVVAPTEQGKLRAI